MYENKQQWVYHIWISPSSSSLSNLALFLTSARVSWASTAEGIKVSIFLFPGATYEPIPAALSASSMVYGSVLRACSLLLWGLDLMWALKALVSMKSLLKTHFPFKSKKIFRETLTRNEHSKIVQDQFCHSQLLASKVSPLCPHRGQHQFDQGPYNEWVKNQINFLLFIFAYFVLLLSLHLFFKCVSP